MPGKSRATQYAEEKILPRLIDFPFRRIKLESMVGFAHEAKECLPRLNVLRADLALYREIADGDASDDEARRTARYASQETRGLFVVYRFTISQATIQKNIDPMDYLPETTEEIDDIIAVLQDEYIGVLSASVRRPS